MGGYEAGRMPGQPQSRRDFLRLGGAIALGLTLAPDLVEAALSPNRSLSFYAMHTGESLSVDYVVNGRYQRDGLRAIDRVLRDYYTDEEHPIDPIVLDVLHTVRRALGTQDAFHVVSGYRTPETNERKRLEHRWSGVAKNSYHLTGQAVDVFLPSRDLRQLRRVAVALGGGGVGYYPRSGFVHLDSGPTRRW